MDSPRMKSRPNPKEKANIVSVLLWWWATDVFRLGYTKVAELEDFYELLKEDRSNILGDRLEKRWTIELENSKKQKRRPNLLRTILRTFLLEYSVLTLQHIITEFFIRLSMPFLLGGVLRYFRNDSMETYETALWYAAGMCTASILNVICFNHFCFGAAQVGSKIRIAVCSVMYRKALRLRETALGETTPGKVVNLIANDVNRFTFVSLTTQYMWSAPLCSLFVAYILYSEIGYSSLIGIAIIFTVAPIQSYTGKLMSKYRLQTAIKTDERVRLMDEIISGVQVIKMYAWEKPFCALVELARKLELRVVTKSSYIRGIYMTFSLFTTRMALCSVLISMLLFGHKLTADKVFVISTYFNILSFTMTSMFVRGVAELAECLVGVRRLQNFLMYEEYESRNVIVCKQPSSNYNGKTHSESDKISGQNISYINGDVENCEISNGDVENCEISNGDVENCEISNDDVKWNRSASIRTDSKDSITNEQVFCVHNWAVKMTNVNAKWELGNLENTLEDLNLEVEKGKLYAVIGMVGSGKSSLLSAILGEISLVNGETRVHGKLSYAGQDAWVFGSTIRQNILFGQNYDCQRYQEVIKVCALLKDLQQFPQGDQTVVGERGNMLSGGQKARINLARALYRQSDIYLLDDPLSAVDAHVSKHLFHDCIKKYLAGKTTILATHQLQYIKEVDGIILLEQGKMKYFSHYQDLLAYQPEYNVLLSEEDEEADELSVHKRMREQQIFTSSTKNSTLEISKIEEGGENENVTKKVDLEKTSRGVVKGSLLVKYFQIGANLYRASFILFMFIITQIVVSLNDYFVPILLNAEEKRRYLANLESSNRTTVSANATSLDTDIWPMTTYIYIYTGIVLSIFIVAIIRSWFLYNTCTMCNQRLHNLMFNALIRTGMRFFDTNSSGRILNRFSKDMGAIDELLPKGILDSYQSNMLMIGAVTVTCIVNPFFIIPILVISITFYLLRKKYLNISKDIKRLEGMTRSPVFTRMSTTLNGLFTIRAYCNQSILTKEFDRLQDLHTSCMYTYDVTTTIFSFYLDIFCVILITIVTFTFLLTNNSFTGGEVGLGITQILAISGSMQYVMRQNADMTNQIMALERIIDYIQLPPESNFRDRGVFLQKKKSNKWDMELPANAPKNWPSKGSIEFKNVYMRYADETPPVLKELDIVILAGEKIGIVGRTGAGKSSLISALFRLAKVEGVIEIDGVNTDSIALEDLRCKISIIPQDPVLFSGTLRSNLDPFDEFSDKELWDVLEEVELKDAIVNVGNGLESRVFERGSNYSVGQRQLVCLARAILRNNRILMLDEATANVDPHTDALIQCTIRKRFATCTMLIVAHRLNTIMDSDKVLVMDKGYVAEYDHPHVLLQNNHGKFTSLVRETNTYDQLVKVAKQSYIEKYGKTE
ncbi:multidrug resistance-associated protein 4-like [Odontomachus brunneus]|uniref:multidrug resistance-associated protein 4-like n=1 Tax=Odontomachus brunneus TaxID=486640 RepID=UPI0013F1DAEA|nr:multidrug resistance-associated protein 4-like [Odontomachus brunneus]XP_032678120.1 multidrug resistance-associated protein 4-like [Odontomachus brunneus]XP_032678121.1 multidrug resistance-associated protein 4-like [Odontomachus brunneus]XP_032678123.1 multidrug resistance-associated protein 4-like [Odontomachus brunneus]XP_032678124.1 multidrug resistance-associated protein 4-like [Odontomachus brunneus]